jgi:DNA polymerase III subunit beta
MKFLISKDELTQLLTNIQNVVAQKPTIPILSNFLIEAGNDELVLTATDLTVGTRCHMPAKILEEGATTLPAKRFYQLIRELTAATIEVSANTSDVSDIVADSSHFRLNGMNKNEFPEFPNLSDALKFTCKQSELKELLTRVSFAVAREENHTYAWIGLLLRISKGKACFVGTDGKRLAKSQISIDIDVAVDREYIIPLKAVDEMSKVLEDSEKELTFYLMEQKVALQTENLLIITKLLLGEFPDFERVIPSQMEINIALHREELIQLLKQISLFTVEAGHSVRFTFQSGELILTANSMEIGEGKVSMPVNYDGEVLNIAFNPSFFLDILRHCKDETVNLGLIDSYNPGIVTDSTESVFMIMPMRLNE